eukprot:ctg_900.g374
MPGQRSRQRAGLDVIDVHQAGRQPHRQAVAARRPAHRAHGVRRRLHIAQLGHFGGVRAPQIHRVAQTDRQHVARRPVHQVEVEVVRQRGRVQHFEGHAGDAALRATRTQPQRTRHQRVGHAHRRGVQRRWRRRGGDGGRRVAGSTRPVMGVVAIRAADAGKVQQTAA